MEKVRVEGEENECFTAKESNETSVFVHVGA
ncbi:hypothetical protein GFC30_132 [Anoxybacillus amylolyticus]|uniref:Uncharacterized protein n=1 Tax=Anoxybacteroides amylolyticum TaxID=294699 RepID=A0A161HUR8_9BACL|nr:hypothetical protein GFC30_132 [Anoxybacillus amylolyticus]